MNNFGLCTVLCTNVFLYEYPYSVTSMYIVRAHKRLWSHINDGLHQISFTSSLALLYVHLMNHIVWRV